MQPSPEVFSSCNTETLYLLNNNSPFSSSPPVPGNHHSTFCLYDLNTFKYLSGIVQNLSFCHWLTLLSIMFSRFIHVAACQNFLPFKGRVIFHYMYIPHFCLFTYQSVDTWLCPCFSYCEECCSGQGIQDPAFNSLEYIPKSVIS